MESIHLLTSQECQRVQEPRAALNRAAGDFMRRVPLLAGTARREGRPAGRPLSWEELKPREKMQLLLAHVPPGTGARAFTPSVNGMSREEWSKQFVQETLPHAQKLLRERDKMDKELHPEPPPDGEEDPEVPEMEE